MRKYYTRVLDLFYIFSIFLDVTEKKKIPGLGCSPGDSHSQGVEGHACDSDRDLSFSLNLFTRSLRDPITACTLLTYLAIERTMQTKAN